MTTAITKTVKRVTQTTHFKRRIVVSMAPGDILGFRLERTRKTYWLPIANCMDLAVKTEVAAMKAAKKKARKHHVS